MAALVGTSHQTHLRWANLQITLPIATSMMIISTVQNPQMIFSRVLEWPAVRFVGRLSYSFYVYQQFFFIHNTPRAAGWVGKLQVFPLVLIGPIVAAIASYYLIERPIIRWAHRRFPNHPQAAASLKQSV
jgi:peptidoglycan/LPS O-acetylase OafA/YrhL